MPKKLKYTTKEIKEKIFELTGNEYEMMGEYKNAYTKFKIKHNLCGCEYMVCWNAFQQGKRCPKCAGCYRYTDSEISELISEMTKGEYTKLSTYKNKRTKFKIKHSLCGHEYMVSWDGFQQGRRCPKCARDARKYTDTEINNFIHEMTKGEYTKLSEYKGSKAKFSIKHSLCGHVYMVSWDGFQKGSRCPKCAGNRKYTDTEISELVSEMTNGEYTKQSEYKNNRTKFKIRHEKCNFEYMVSWDGFQKGNRCPKCNQSKGEKFIEDYLTNHNIPFSTQIKFNDCRHERTLPFDFGILNKEKKVIALIEYDGRQHFEPIEIWGGQEALQQTQIRDQIKNEYCAKNNIPLLRIKYDENTEEKLFNFLVQY